MYENVGAAWCGTCGIAWPPYAPWVICPSCRTQTRWDPELEPLDLLEATRRTLDLEQQIQWLERLWKLPDQARP
jgi:hypothetical protein